MYVCSLFMGQALIKLFPSLKRVILNVEFILAGHVTTQL